MLGQLSLEKPQGEKLRQRIQIKIVPNREGNIISKSLHYLRRIRTGGRQLTYGVLYDGEFVGVMVLASPTFHQKKGLILPLLSEEVVELARMWLSCKRIGKRPPLLYGRQFLEQLLLTQMKGFISR